MSNSTGGADWENIQDTVVVFEPGDRIASPITDPKTLKAINEAMQRYRQQLGLDGGESNGANSK